MSEITFRLINPSDAAGFLALIEQLDRESNFLMFNANERNSSVEQCHNDIKRILGINKSIIIVAVNSLGNLVGHVTGECPKVQKKGHVMRVSIGVLRKYYGIGRKLVEKFIQYTDSNDIVRLEAEIAVNNLPCLNLAKKFGFVIEGRKQCALKIQDHCLDEYMIARIRGEV